MQFGACDGYSPRLRSRGLAAKLAVDKSVRQRHQQAWKSQRAQQGGAVRRANDSILQQRPIATLAPVPSPRARRTADGVAERDGQEVGAEEAGKGHGRAHWAGEGAGSAARFSVGSRGGHVENSALPTRRAPPTSGIQGEGGPSASPGPPHSRPAAHARCPSERRTCWRRCARTRLPQKR